MKWSQHYALSEEICHTSVMATYRKFSALPLRRFPAFWNFDVLLWAGILIVRCIGSLSHFPLVFPGGVLLVSVSSRALSAGNPGPLGFCADSYCWRAVILERGVGIFGGVIATRLEMPCLSGGNSLHPAFFMLYIYAGRNILPSSIKKSTD
jgi:hypothetical protein